MCEDCFSSQIGELVLFDGVTGDPDSVLTTKAGKDTFASVQPVSDLNEAGVRNVLCVQGFRVNDQGIAYYKVSPSPTVTFLSLYHF